MQEDMYRGDGLNLYAYCANNSVMYYDPSGYEGNNDLRFCKPKEKPGAPPDEGGEFSDNSGKLYLPYTDEIPPTVQSRINLANEPTSITFFK